MREKDIKELNFGEDCKTIEEAMHMLIEMCATFDRGWRHPKSKAEKGFGWSLTENDNKQLSDFIVSFEDGRAVVHYVDEFYEKLDLIAKRVDDEYWEWAKIHNPGFFGGKEGYHKFVYNGKMKFGVNVGFSSDRV